MISTLPAFIICSRSLACSSNISTASRLAMARDARRRISAPTIKTAATTTRANSSFNINNALKKAEEGVSLRSLASQPVTTLQGIGPKHSKDLESLGIKTIGQLAEYKFFHLARSISVLSSTEEIGGRHDDSEMNIMKGIDKEFQSLPLKDLVGMPVHAFKGIHPDAGGEAFRSLGVKTVADLAEFKYCRWAEAIVVAAEFEIDADVD